MVFVLDDSSKYGVQVQSEIDYAICLRHLFWSRQAQTQNYNKKTLLVRSIFWATFQYGPWPELSAESEIGKTGAAAAGAMWFLLLIQSLLQAVKKVCYTGSQRKSSHMRNHHSVPPPLFYQRSPFSEPPCPPKIIHPFIQFLLQAVKKDILHWLKESLV